MQTHHGISAIHLITRAVSSVAKRATRVINLSPVIELDERYKTTFLIIPVDPEYRRVTASIILASDCKWPWSPVEIGRRIVSSIYRFWKWFERNFGYGAAKPSVVGMNILVISSMSRGAYTKKPVPLWEYLRRCGVKVDPGLVYWSLKHDVKVMTRDIRRFIRWFRHWLSNPKAMEKTFGDFLSFVQRAKEELIRNVKFYFRTMSNWFKSFAEKRLRSSLDKGVEPYGKLRETIEYLKTVSYWFEAASQYSFI